MEFHPLADIFPMMGPGEYAALKADIAEYGLREPITLAEGKVADGRNRYNACKELGIEPRCVEWDGQGSLVAFIISMNLHRRHLNESQRDMIAAKIATLSKGRSDILSNAQICAFTQQGAADLMNVSRRGVQQAKKVQEEGTPELIQAVEQGDVAVSLAARATSLPEEKQVEMVDLVEDGVKPKEAYRQVTRPKPVEFSPNGKLGREGNGR